MRAWTITAIAAAMSALASPALGVTITFDDVNPNPCCAFMSSYTSEGMAFTNEFGNGAGVFFPPDVNPTGSANMDPGGASITGDPLRMRPDGGGTFDLLGFTFGVRPDQNVTQAYGFIKVRFVYDDGRDEIESFDVHQYGPEALMLSRTGLRSVRWLRGTFHPDLESCLFCDPNAPGVWGTGVGTYQIDDVIVDNIAYSPDPLPPAPVPEPATWAFMIGGFGVAGVALRRRRVAR